MPAPGGYKGRVLDVLNTAAQFLAFTDVLLNRASDEAGEEPTRYDVILIRKEAIEFVVPLR